MIRLPSNMSRIYLGISLIVFLGMSAPVARATPPNPVPFIGALSPVSVAPGGADFVLTVSGDNFVAASVVSWGNTTLATTYVSATQLTAVVPAALTASSGTGWITVSSAGPSGIRSNIAFLPVGVSTASLNFSSSTLTLGASPFRMAEGDFNGDGRMDLAVANWGDNTVSIFMGNGDGTFQAARNISVSGQPFSVTVGDFNGDGKVDLAVGFESSVGISILLGNGDGTFQAPISTAAGSFNYGLVAGDFNKDGNLDLAVAGYLAGQIFVLLGNGDGTFQPAVAYSVSSQPIFIRAADLNGDGNLDLVAGDWFGPTISVLLGVGDGTFQAAQSYTAGTAGSDVAIADFNGDGKLDLIATSQSDNNVYFLAGVGDGTFLPAQAIPVGLSSNVVGVGDFNADGKLDFAIASDSAEVGIILGNGDGTFHATQQIAFPSSTFPFEVVVGNFNTGGGLGIAVEDNSSGTTEILIPTVSISPGSFDFGNQAVGAASAAQDFTITNSTSQTVTFTTIGFTGTNSGDFSDTTNCGSTLASGAVCKVHVTFTAGAVGVRSGSLSVSDNAPDSPQTAGLTGTGVNASAVSLSATTITFPGQPVGTPSTPQSVTLTNTGNMTLNIASIVVTGTNAGDFTLAPAASCGTTVAVHAMCAINVTFTPSAAGVRSAAVTLTDDALDSPESIALSGQGLLQPTADLSATNLTYSGTAVGSTSASQMVTLTNNGNAPLIITGIVAGGTNKGDFTVSNTCSSPIAAGGHCSISATFTPTGSGARTATVTISDNAALSPQVITLQGTGQDFSLSLSAVSPIEPGSTANSQLTVTSVDGYNQLISLACSGAPALSTCAVTPGSITPTGTTTTAALTLTTTGKALVAPVRNPSTFPPAAFRLFGLVASLVTLLLMAVGFLAPGFRKFRPVGLTLAAVLLLSAIGLVACGTSSKGSSTPAGNYTLTVTATSGTLMRSATVQITIQ
jgi:FG-GAP-like repeat/Abnormal spindle-like microcephaly-assoc'd, ASPM-SPD-2-Hydin